MAKRAPERRIAALVLPELLVELASEALFSGKKPGKRAPLGVLLVPTQAAAEADELSASARLSAVASPFSQAFERGGRW